MKSHLFHIVLDQPQIPNNTGNIGRTCVGMNCDLHLIKPMGFEISDKQLKRAGLDYWKDLDWYVYESWQDWWEKLDNKKRVFFMTTKSTNLVEDNEFKSGDWLVFGSETKGISEDTLKSYPKQSLTLKCMNPDFRSLNLSNAVAMTLYTALTQVRARQPS